MRNVPQPRPNTPRPNDRVGWAFERAVLWAALTLILAFVGTSLYGFFRSAQESRRDACRRQMDHLEWLVSSYRRHYDVIPDQLADLDAHQEWTGGNRVPWDLWGREFVYVRRSATTYTLSSLGEDGVEGGWFSDEDLVREVKLPPRPPTHRGRPPRNAALVRTGAGTSSPWSDSIGVDEPAGSNAPLPDDAFTDVRRSDAEYLRLLFEGESGGTDDSRIVPRLREPR